MNHLTSRRHTKAALPTQDATILIEGIAKKIVKCTARKAFTVNNSHVKEGEIFFLVASERRVNRYYIVHYNSLRNAYQCSCGCGPCEHDHLRTVREYIRQHPAKAHAVTKVTKAQPIPQNRIEKAESALAMDATAQNTPIDWKAIQKADRARQKALHDEYWQEALRIRAEQEAKAV